MKRVLCVEGTVTGIDPKTGYEYLVTQEKGLYYYLYGVPGGWMADRFVDVTNVPRPPQQTWGISAQPLSQPPDIQKEIEAVTKKIAEAHAHLSRKEIHCKAPACGKANDFGVKTCYMCGGNL